MHLYKTMRNFLLDQDYFIDMWQNNLHVYGIVDIETLEEKKIVLILEPFKLKIEGKDFRVLKLTKKEILIQGEYQRIEVER